MERVTDLSNSLLSAICKLYPLTILHTILMAPAKLTKLQKYIMDLFILLWHYDHMINSILLIFLGTLSIAVTFNTETLFTVDAQPSIENSSNLTYPNNPTLTLGERLNETGEQESNSNESDSNLGLI